MKFQKYDIRTLCFLFFGVLLCAIYVRSFPLVAYGDGTGYIMQTIAFQNHLSFGITENDIEQAKNEFYYQSESLDKVFYTDPANHLFEYKDAKYSDHYGVYSALSLPLKMIAMALGKYPLWGFFWTNYLLYITANFVVYFRLQKNKKNRFIVVLLTMVNPVLFYLDWVHTEIYIYSFVVIGLVFYYNKQYARAIFFLCIAAMQNPGVLPFAMAVGIHFIIDKVTEFRKQNREFIFTRFIEKYALTIILHGLCYIPGLIPIASTYIKFHSINLIADVRSEHKYVFHKILDYMFDLNLGIFPFEPILLITFIIMLVWGLRQCPIPSVINLIGIGGMLFVVANEIQINSGMCCIMRYNVWILPAIIFFVVLNWNQIWRYDKRIKYICYGEICFTMLIILYILYGGGKYSSNQFAPWTKWALNHFPHLYNPSHGIFYSRALGQERYYSSDPVPYITADGRVRKILLSREAEKTFYSDDWIIFDGKGNIIDKNKVSIISVDENDFKYINIMNEAYRFPKIELEAPIFFYSDKYNARDYVCGGLSEKEEWGSWTDGDELVMFMQIDSKASILSGHIDIARTFYQPQSVNIYVNDVEVYRGIVSDNQDIKFKFDNNESNGLYSIKLELPDSVRPADVINSQDKRDLGLGILTFKIFED